MKGLMIFFMSILLASQVIATEDGGTQQFLEEQLKQSETGRSREDLDFLQKLTLPMQAQDQPFIDAMQQRQQQQGSGEIKPVAKALYFVSFSIPIEGLKRMVHDADQYPIPVTLRGLVNNDLRQTANAVLSLVKEGKRGGVQIDPVSFRTYGITAVPALVVTCKEHFDRVAGNIRLTAALKKVAESGQCAQTAQALLKTAADR